MVSLSHTCAYCHTLSRSSVPVKPELCLDYSLIALDCPIGKIWGVFLKKLSIDSCSVDSYTCIHAASKSIFNCGHRTFDLVGYCYLYVLDAAAKLAETV